MQYGVIILAAGKGTRMKSDLPKVLHPVGGKPMLMHLTDLAHQMHATPLVVFGHGGEQLQQAFADRQATENTNKNASASQIQWVEQTELLGTGHAVLQTISHLEDDRLYFILVGDAPLIRQTTLEALAQEANNGIAVLTVNIDNPHGYGRIIRNADGYVARIVEEKDATPEERQQREINSGVFAVRGDLLKALLPQIENNNAQGEHYLTDIVALANANGHGVSAHCISDSNEVLGCNNKVQLAQLERIYQSRLAEQYLLAGTTIIDPARFDVRGTLTVGKNCFIDINAVFLGDVVLGDNVHIAPNCIISDSHIGSDTEILANTVIENAHVGESAVVGPFARLRPNTQLADQTKIGNFVEIKNAKIDKGSKVNHLSYIGDATLATQVNIGAGTITCNYDGANKHQTVIGDNAFIGSNTALVAPVTIGSHAVVGAGSTITKDTAPDTLAIARAKQTEIKHWKRPTKNPSK